MPAPWLLLLALLHALHYKLRWRWRCAGLIERLHEIGGLLEIRTTSCLALNRGVSQHFGKVDYTKVSSLDMVMSFVWVLGGVFGFACVLASSAIASCGLFWGGVVGGGSLACWFGFACCGEFDGVITASCLGSVGRPRVPRTVRRSQVPCRWVGRRRVSFPRKGWKGRLVSRVQHGPRGVPRSSCGSPSPRHTPLNALFRGGGGGEGSTEQDLLKGLQELLQKFNTSNEKKGGQAKKGKGKPTDHATKGKGKTQSAPATGDKLGKGKAGKPQKGSVVSPSKGNLGNVSKGSTGGTSLEPPNTTTSEGALLGALRRLVERSGKNNGEGLLDRLTGLVQAASTGKSLSSKGRKNKNRPKIGGSPPTQAVGAKSKGKGKGLSPSEGPVKGKGSGKDFQLIRLLPSGWPPSAAMSVTKLREALSRGEVPSGCVTWCTEVQIAELRNLAQVHQITKAYALVCLINKGQSEPPIGNASRHLLPATDAAGKAGLGQFWACPLASQYPQLPSCSTSSRAPKVERALTTLRVQIPQRLLQADGWRNVVRSPAAVLRTVISPTAFHSTFKFSSGRKLPTGLGLVVRKLCWKGL